VRALGRIKAVDAVDRLISLLNEPSSALRVQVARALGRIGDKRALPYLVATLDSGSPELQEACVQAIGEIGEKKSVSRLLKLFEQNPSDSLTGFGAEAISKHGLVDAIWEIYPRMHHTHNPVLQRQLAIAVGNLMGKPGEFYKFVTGDRINQTKLLEQLFEQVRENCHALEQQASTKPSQDQRQPIAHLLNQIETEMESDHFAEALQKLSILYSQLGRILYPHAGGDDESLIAAAIYRNQQFGLAIWLIKEAEMNSRQESHPELLWLDSLISLYSLAHVQIPRTA